MHDLIDEAGRDERRQCLVPLLTLTAAGPIGSAEPAHLAALRLIRADDRSGADRGVDPAELPGWVDHLGRTEDGWHSGRAVADQASLTGTPAVEWTR